MSETSTCSLETSAVKPSKLKVVLLGDQAVGKTSIIKNYTRGIFQLKQPSTIGIDYISKTVEAADRPASLELWDTAGQERFRSLIPNYLRNSAAVLIVFDLTRTQTFLNVGRWREFAREVKGLGLKLFYVGNKADLVEERRVSKQEIDDMMEREESAQYFQTSAKDRHCLEQMFLQVCNQLLKGEQIKSRFSKEVRLDSQREIPLQSCPQKRWTNCC